VTDTIQRKLADAAKRYAAAHRELGTRRDELYVAIRRASGSGMSMREIGDTTGLSHQRVAQIVRGD
jgi:hypothetical protein